VLIKGGHHNNLAASDVLYIYEKDKHFWFHAKRVETLNTHGTGCTLSSAIASYLAQGYSLLESVGTAKKYLTSAIESGSRFDWGQGHGPVDHFYALHPRGAKIDF
jgi:hydroxymethylpyrimidine/phosphomethylpyrimidine kinase